MRSLTGRVKNRCPDRVAAAPWTEAAAAEVHVIYTNPRATRAALQAADAMAQCCMAQVHLLVPQVVPLGFSLSRPPVSTDFVERRALGMARECCSTAAISIQVVLCGSREQCVERMLCPNSLVIVGSRKQRWSATEHKLVRRLRSRGHIVIHVLE